MWAPASPSAGAERNLEMGSHNQRWSVSDHQQRQSKRDRLSDPDCARPTLVSMEPAQV